MANYALVENNQIVERHDSLPKSWRNVSGLHLLDDQSSLNDLGWYIVTKVSPDFDSTLQYITDYQYDFSDNAVYETPVFTDIVQSTLPTEEELFQTALTALRIERDKLIAESDWTQLADVQSIHDDIWKTAWATYRQQLRDLPNQCITGEINIYEIEWPTKP